MKEEDIRKKELFDKYLLLVKQDIEIHFKDKHSFERINCPACDSTNIQDEFIKDGFTYQICNKCKTLFVNPRPTYKSLINFYSDSISNRYWTNTFFKTVEEIRTEKIFKPRAEWLIDYFWELDDITIGDIGAGYGNFLYELKKLSPNNRFIAIEPSIEQSNICKSKGLDCLTSSLEELVGMEDTFDILTSFELFEHLQNPRYFIEKIHGLLKPNGYLLLTTLNSGGFDIQLLWDKAKCIFPPPHLNFYNTSSISILLEDCGFEIISISTPGKLDWDIVENMIKKEDVKISRFWMQIAESDDTKMKEELQTWISNNNLSSHMRILCRKKEITKRKCKNCRKNNRCKNCRK